MVAAEAQAEPEAEAEPVPEGAPPIAAVDDPPTEQLEGMTEDPPGADEANEQDGGR